MILRYFYIDKYNDSAQNLDVNLGGKYRFHYLIAKNKLHIAENKEYVENLYDEYNVISDVSAILGKNSAGKTTVLRMINSIFNGFDIYNTKKYIILFEKEHNYILYTNFLQIVEYESNIPDKKILSKRGKYFNAIDILKDVGLIYFSNIFDKATPFQGNANLIDISTNYLFERFYKDTARKQNLWSNEKANIMLEYKSEGILAEIDFLLDLKRKTGDSYANLLFDVPTQIELGFTQVLPDYINKPLCINDEYNRLLIKIQQSLGDYLGENQDFTIETISLFQREVIFYFLFDELSKFCKEDKYNTFGALKYWINKIENQDWEISNYYHEILEQLKQDNLIENDSTIIQEDGVEEKEEIYQESSYADIRDDFGQLYNQLSAVENINYNQVLYKITIILNFLKRVQCENYRIIVHYLEQAEVLLEEIQNDLFLHDYDLYNITCIYEAYDCVEKAYAAYCGEESIYPFPDDFLDSNWKEEFDNDEILEKSSGLDSYTENQLNLKQKLIETFMFFSKRYEYNPDTGMLRVMLDCEDILKFIYSFQELECETVVLDIKRNDISSGHSAYLDMCSRINSARKSGEIQYKRNVILLIDEGDIYLHPEKQLAYMNNLLKLLQILYKGKKVQLIVTSNSPFIISDIQASNILYFEKNGNKIESIESSLSNTFASNVNVLLLDSFFVKNGLIGEYARQKIDYILQNLRNGTLPKDKYDQIKKTIEIIGEPVIRRKLETMLLHNIPHDNIQREIQYYENILKQIKGMEND